MGLCVSVVFAAILRLLSISRVKSNFIFYSLLLKIRLKILIKNKAKNPSFL